MNEKWVPFINYEGIYEISTLGRVRSVDHQRVGRYGNLRNYKGKILSPSLSWQGYRVIGLHKNKKKTTVKIARNVLISFDPVDNYDELYVDHINGDRTDDRLENLRWVKPSENNHNNPYARYLMSILDEHGIGYKSIKDWIN